MTTVRQVLFFCPQVGLVVRSIMASPADFDKVFDAMVEEYLEIGGQAVIDENLALCAHIREYEKSKSLQHMVGITADGGEVPNEMLFASSADWMAPNNGDVLEYRYNPPASDGAKVVLNDTDHTWGIGCEVGWVWKCFTRGMNPLFMDPWEPLPVAIHWNEGNLTKNQRYYHVWDPVRRNLGYTRDAALRLYLNRCVPHGELCSSTYCLADAGARYVCYFPAGGFEGVNLRGVDGVFKVEWLNPATGVTFDAPDISGGRRMALHAPFDGASVLFLSKTET